MKEINGLILLELLNEATEQGADFEVLETSVQGLYGIYAEFNKMVRYDDDMFNVVLVKEIKK